MNILNKKFTFKELFSSVEKMKEGSKIGKRFVETNDGTKIPLELLNKIAKKEFGYSNFYTLWRQDGNAGQNVVMEAYKEFKKSAKQRMKEGGRIAYLKQLLENQPDAKIEVKKKLSGDIVYVNGQTAFNLSDRGFTDNDLRKNAMIRAYKASKSEKKKSIYTVEELREMGGGELNDAAKKVKVPKMALENAEDYDEIIELILEKQSAKQRMKEGGLTYSKGGKLEIPFDEPQNVEIAKKALDEKGIKYLLKPYKEGYSEKGKSKKFVFSDKENYDKAIKELYGDIYSK